MDDWDPKSTDYNDVGFNSYLQGPGSYLDSNLLPGLSRQCKDDVRYKLHVRNIPSDLTEQGMKNLFSNFGEILDIYKHPAHNWGFVTYATIREAEFAIRELNRNEKLFKLIVQFARSAAEKERLKQEEIKADMLKAAVDSIPFVPAETKPPKKLSSGIGRGSLPLHMQTFGNPGFRSGQAALSEKEKDGFFSYPIAGIFEAVNRVLMDSMSITLHSENGFRQVTMGRGYFPLSKVPCVVKGVGKKMQTAYDSLKKERFEFGEEIDLNSLTDGCKICGANTIYHCICGTPYCCRNCQGVDWPEHKEYCTVKRTATEKKLQQSRVKSRKKWSSSAPGKIANEKPLLTAKSSSSSTSSIVHWLSKNYVINGRLTRWLHKTCFLSVVPVKFQKEFNQIRNLLPLACDRLLDLNYKPEVGEMVAALVRDREISWMMWNRAFVLSVHKDYYEVNLCDLGLIAKVTTVTKLPQDFINIPEFGVHCTITEYSSKDIKWVPLETEVVLRVQDVNKDRKMVKCVAEEECSVILRQWCPNIEIGNLEAVRLESGDTVVLSAFFDQSNIYVRPVSQKNKEAFAKLSRDVAVYCYSAHHLPVLPLKKMLVGCRFPKDGNYYRAQILHMNESSIEVCFVDYGNTEIVSQDDIIELAEELKMHPCMAVKVSLEDVDCAPLTKEVLEYVFKLIGEEKEMKIFFGSNGVKLQLPEGKSFNKQFRLLLEPSWKQKMQQGLNLLDGPVFMEQDLPILEPPLNKPVELFILNKMDDGTFICCEFHSKTMYYIQKILTKEITEYCNTSDQQQYTPRYQELCLAKWDVDGKWYRALFISDYKVKLENNILFMDFGNMAYVDSKDIRKMIPDFMSTPSAAFLCSIDCDKEVTVTADLVKVGLVYEAVILEKIGHGSFLIEMPHVSAVENKNSGGIQ